MTVPHMSPKISFMYTTGKKYFENVFFPISMDEGEDFDQPLFREKRSAVTYLKNGEASYECGNKTCRIQAPAILLRNEEARIRVSSCSGASCETVYFHPSVVNSHLDYDILRGVSEASRITDNQDTYLFGIFGSDPTAARVLQLDTHRNLECDFLFKKLGKAIHHNESDYCPCWMRAVLISLLIFMLDMDMELDELIDVSEHAYNFKDVILYLYSHYREDLTLAGISKEFGTNRTSLNDKFKKVVGSSVMAFVRNIRINAAAKYLRSSEETITRICTDTEFKDISYFCKLFKQTFGSTPKEYRIMYGQPEDIPSGDAVLSSR